MKQITRSLDLNTLHALSLACRQFRANLLQFRRYLVSHSLRCENDESYILDQIAKGLDGGFVNNNTEVWRSEDDRNSVHGHGTNGFRSFEVRRLTSGKVGKCARDMVRECRRCETVICRVSITTIRNVLEP